MLLPVITRAGREFVRDECPARAAALAYYTVFALPPLLVLLITLAGVVWEPGEVRAVLSGQFTGMLGTKAGGQIDEMIRSADQTRLGGPWSTALGIAGFLFGATGAFLQLQGALNRTWDVRPDQSRGGVRHFLLKRLLSLGMVLAMGFLSAVSLALTAALSAFVAVVDSTVAPPLLFLLDLVSAFVVLTLLFALIYKVLPDARIAWGDVWVGATVTALLFVIGKFAIGFYLGRTGRGDEFGAAGALAVVLLWAYYASMILLFGAEFTQAWAEMHGRQVRPESGADLVKARE